MSNISNFSLKSMNNMKWVSLGIFQIFQSKGEKQTENSIHLDAYYITFERLMTLDTGYEAPILGYLQGMNCLLGSDGVRCKIQAE